MSKDATRFLSLLESYNASNHASGQINENNQLALMSMFLGPKMLGKGQLTPGMLNMGNRDSDKGDTVSKGKVHSEESNTPGYSVHKVESETVSKSIMNGEESKADKENTDDKDIENRMKKLVLKDNENNQTNLNDEPASEGKRIDNTNGNLYKEQVTPKTRTMLSARNEDGMIEKLFSLMGSAGQGSKGERNTPAQHGITKLKTSPPPGLSLHRLSTPSPQSAAPLDHSSPRFSMMYSLMESLGGIPPLPHNNNFGSPHPTVSGPTHSTPRSREAENNNGFHGDSCDGVLGLEGRGVLLKEIENMIDQKFAQMEERLTKKVEQKLTEKAQSDNARLEKIEEHLSKLCEHFLR